METFPSEVQDHLAVRLRARTPSSALVMFTGPSGHETIRVAETSHLHLVGRNCGSVAFTATLLTFLVSERAFRA
jgi:hypothetical protein